METLKQRQYSPMPMEEQVVIFYSAKNGFISNVPDNDIDRFNRGLVACVKEKDPGILEDIRKSGDFSQETEAKLKSLTEQYLSSFVVSKSL